MIKKMVVSVVVLCAVMLCVTGSADAAKYTLKLGFVVTEQDPIFKGAEALKKAVEERTNGELTIEIYPSSQLGDTKDVQEQAKMGANVGSVTDPGRLAEMVHELGIMLAPYVADNYDELRTISLSKPWKEWEEKLAQEHRLRILSFNWYQGARHLLTNTPVTVPADLKGIRMRTPGSPVWQETVRAMGATPVALAWAEVYPALQQKVIDGAEAQYPAIYGASLYEVIKYITKTSHFLLNTCVAVSEDWFQGLPEEYQKILLEEALKAGDVASQLTLDKESEYEAQIKEQGVTVNEIDTTPFKEATAVVYEKLGYGDARKLILDVLGK
jgi:tripartite ATP-independent transporter DctP family solute receptor